MDAPLPPRLSRRRLLASLGLAAAGGAAAEIDGFTGRPQPAASGPALAS